MNKNQIDALNSIIQRINNNKSPQWTDFGVVKGRLPIKLPLNTHLSTWYEKVWTFCKSLLNPLKLYNTRRRAIRCLTTPNS